MKVEDLRALLENVRGGSLAIEDALERLAILPFRDIGFARVDHHRALRTGGEEVVFAPGKQAAEVVRIVRELVEKTGRALVTRAGEETQAAVVEAVDGAQVHPRSGTIVVDTAPLEPIGRVLVVTAGTADLAVAEEALVTARFRGAEAELLADVGVAGVHRVLGETERLREADALVVCAGMEGALASVVGGLVEAPVFAVPTSAGYGASFGGVAALLGMLNSCSPNVACVNIDNGFGAGSLAALVARRTAAQSP